MHVPALLPDELIGGYLTRLAHLNGIASGEAVLRTLIEQPGRPRGQLACPTPFELIAQVTRVEKTRLLQAHSLVPLHQAVSVGRRSIAHGDDRRRTIERRWREGALHTGLWRCPQCVREDVAFWGFVYVRRSAQLPGIHWCAKHAVRLVRSGAAPSAPEPLELTPAETRYAEIMDGILDLTASVPLTQASVRLRERAQSTGLRVRRSSTGPTMSKLAASVMPRPWLERHRPLLLGDRGDDRLDAVHTSPVQPFPTEDYVLALTVLHGSAHEALADFLRPLSDAELLRVEELARRRRGAKPEAQATTRATRELPEPARQ